MKTGCHCRPGRALADTSPMFGHRRRCARCSFHLQSAQAGVRPDLVSDVTRRACDRPDCPGSVRTACGTLWPRMLRRGVKLSISARYFVTVIWPPPPSAPKSTWRHCERSLPWRGASLSALANAAADYLRLRNQLGHDLAEYHRLLPRFVAFLDDAGGGDCGCRLGVGQRT